MDGILYPSHNSFYDMLAEYYTNLNWEEFAK